MNDNTKKAIQNNSQYLQDWLDMTGYILKTTFWDDFTIAEKFGKKAIQDTFNRAFNEWKYNVEYITELYLVMNVKLWLHYEFDSEYTDLYDEYWVKVDRYCMDNLKGKDLDYFIKTTD